MAIYIYKDNQQSGPFDDDAVRGWLRAGNLSPDDLGCRAGDQGWTRLGEMFPAATATPTPSATAPIASAAVGGTAMAAAPAKKGGCLKGGLIGVGLLALLLGIVVAAGSRFIPSASCDAAESDARRIDKLRSDIEKAKSDMKYDRIGPLQIELDSVLSGAIVSQRYCNEDKFRNNAVAGVGVFVAFVGILMAIIGIIVGRRK